MKNSKIMKKILIALCLLIISQNIFSEVVDWTGMNLGFDEYPSWLSNFVEKSNDKKLRKKFDLKKDDIVFYGFSENSSKTFSLTNARLDGVTKLKKMVSDNLDNKKNLNVISVSGYEELYTYWEEDDDEDGDETFRTYIVYSISKENFEKNIKNNE